MGSGGGKGGTDDGVGPFDVLGGSGGGAAEAGGIAWAECDSLDARGEGGDTGTLCGGR